MRIGALTTKFTADQWPLERIVAWAGETGIDCLEIEYRHLDCAALLTPGPRQTLQRQLREAKVGISALSYYAMDLTAPDPAKRAEAIARVEATIDAAEALGVTVVCTLTGHPVPGKSKMDTIRQDLPGIFGPLLERAAKKGITIALENYFRTCIQHLEHWKALFDVLPQQHFGLNFDPSHLDLQGIDYLAAVNEFAPRIVHVHAKDVFVIEHWRRRVGTMDAHHGGFCIPGTGRIAWGPFIHRLRQAKYDGVLSIEHEDPTLSSVDGFRIAERHLRPLIA